MSWFSHQQALSFDDRIWKIPRITALFVNLVLETVDEPVRNVSTQSLINWDAKFMLRSLLEAPGVNI
jgi:hypothetical protein